MALQKQPVSINFMKGLDTKSDPFQVQVGNFLTLVNSVFTTAGRLTKRNGFANITTIPDVPDPVSKTINENSKIQTTLTTFGGNLIATGVNLFSYSQDTDTWLNKGSVQPINMSVQPLIRSSSAQTSPDAAIASNGLTCLTYTDSDGNAYYQVSDSSTGEQVVARTMLPTGAINSRVFLLGHYFIITYAVLVTGTPTLQYIAVPTSTPDMPNSPANISATLASINAGYDGYVANNQLFIAFGAAGTTVKIIYLTSGLNLSTVFNIAGASADLMSVTVNTASQRVYVSYWDSGSTNGFCASFTYTLVEIMTPTQFITGTVITEITSVAASLEETNFTDVLYTYYEVENSYGYSGGARSDYILTTPVTPPATPGNPGAVNSTTVVAKSVGLASKAFLGPSNIYMLVAYGDINQSPPSRNSNQPTYFLVDRTGVFQSDTYMRLAYSNGGGYAVTQVLPSVSVIGTDFLIPYLVTDFLTTVNKGTNLPAGTPTSALYTQTGINMVRFSLDSKGQHSLEVAGALHLTGGQLWEYDGVKPVEHGFNVWPENIGVSTSTSGGSITAGQYYYVFTYEWTDNAGNLHRSAPSIPVTVTTTGSTSTNTLFVPTLRLTYKIDPNPVRIVGYRWSVAQQVYYQFTSVTSPVLNSFNVDFVTIIDTSPDSAILGQTLLYTTGGVIENIAAPASIASALFNNRLFLIDAEDRNLLWFSKQIIESTPVEMSDLLTLYIAPTSGAQGSTGPMTALSAMDDKLIIFKKDAIYYINGTGPDNTGANSTFSDPVFITSTVGCSNPNSIVLMPNGIMFQSDKGIWLLGRDLTTNYIGAPVEGFNGNVVLNATAIPTTNQVRFVLDNNQTLMYDYFFNQWGTHTNISAISTTLYQGVDTYLNKYRQIFQETPNMYVDGATPVLMSLTTSWINIAGLQGYERFYFANLLGTYFTPFKLNVSFAFDYNSSAVQSVQVLPQNYVANYGGEAQWGSGGPWGGPGNIFSARMFPNKQKCESFQVNIQEVYDPSLGQAAGQGLSLSGLALIVGMKRGFRTQSARKSFG